MTPEIAAELDRHLFEGHYWPGNYQSGTCRFCPTWWELTREQRVGIIRQRFHFGRG